MKRIAICFIAILALSFVVFSNVSADERAGRFEIGSGIGASFGQADTSFAFGFSGIYNFTDLVAADMHFYVTVDGVTIFGIVPRLKLTWDLPVENLEIFADILGGILIPDNNVDPTWVAGFGGGLYYWLLDGHLGLGTDLDFTLAGGALWDTDQAFNVAWLLINTYYRF